MPIYIEDIIYYPLKGGGGATVEKTWLDKNGISNDRRYAIAFGDADSLSPLYTDEKWRPWNYCHTLKKNEKLAKLSAFISTTSAAPTDEPTLHILFDNNPVVFGRPSITAERAKIDICLRQILEAPSASLTDSPARPLWDEDGMSITLLSAASVQAFATADNILAENTRFRANIVFSGLPPWQEENLSGAVVIGDVRLALAGGVPRCAATTVNPKTTQRDIKIPQLLHRQRGHTNMGLFATVKNGGEISIGQELRFESA